MKLSKEQIKEIIILNKEGKTQLEIAEQFKVCQATILYWVNEKYAKEKKLKERIYYQGLSKEKKKEMYQKRKEYNKKYHKERYQNDFEFRRRQIDRVMKNKQEKKRCQGG